MRSHPLSDLTRTGIKAAYRIAGLDKKQHFVVWLHDLLEGPEHAAPIMYDLLQDVIQSKFGPFRDLPELERHAIKVAIDVTEFALDLCLDTSHGEHIVTWDIDAPDDWPYETAAGSAQSVETRETARA